MNRARVTKAALLTGVVLLLGGAPAAAEPIESAVVAAPWDDWCEGDAPLSDPTTAGVAAAIDPGPAAADRREGDPFADEPTASVYDTYGYGGLEWVNYDLGCGPDAARDPAAAGLGAIANLTLDGIELGNAALTTVSRFATDPDTLSVLEPVQRVLAEAIGRNLFLPLFVMTALGTALWLAAKARHGDVALAASGSGWVLACAAIGIASAFWWNTIVPLIDDSIGAVQSAVTDSLNGISGGGCLPGETRPSGGQCAAPADAMAGALHEATLYQTWKAGTFGRYDSPTADKYADDLFAASTLSWAEYEEVKGDSDARNDLLKEKQSEFDRIANAIEEEDPAAYQYLAGHKNGARLGYAAVGGIAFLVSSWFIAVANVLTVYALLVVRLVIVLLPLIVLVAGYYPARHRLTGVVNYAVAALIAALTMAPAGAAMVVFAGALLNPSTGLPAWLACLLICAAGVALWRLTKPLRAIRSLATGLSAARERGRHLHVREMGLVHSADYPDNYPRPGEQAADIGRAAPAETTYEWGQRPDGPIPRPAAPNRVAGSVASNPTMQAAAIGAARSAAASSAAGAASGGTATVAAAAIGGAKAAGSQVVTSKATGRNRKNGAPAETQDPPPRPAGGSQRRVYRPVVMTADEAARQPRPREARRDASGAFVIYTPDGDK